VRRLLRGSRRLRAARQDTCHNRLVPGRLWLLVAALVLAVTGCAGSRANKAGGLQRERPVQLRLANVDSDPTNFDSPAYVEAVRRLSGGSIRIETTFGWRSDDPPSRAEKGTIDDVRSGKVDLAIVAARAWDLVGVKSFDALLAPFLVDSLELERRVLEGPPAERMLAGVRSLGLVGLALVPGQLRYPLGVTRALVTPADYVSATIGIRPSGIERATFAALGARTSIYPCCTLAGLDGADLDLSTIATDHYEQQAHALTTNVAFWPRVLVIVMSRKAFDALTPAQRVILRRAGRAAVEPHLAELRTDPQGWLDNVCPGSGLRLVVASTAQRAALRRAVAPVYRELERARQTRDVIGQIRNLRRNAPPTDAVRCARAAPVPVSASGPFDGRWQTSMTGKQLRHAGATRELAQLLRGSWALRFEHGRFDFRNRDAGAHARGTFFVHGDRARFVFARGVGLEGGKVAEVRWSIYNGRLSFIAIPGHMSALLDAAAWERAPSD
jgi:TRAP-type C4-dicarboxylate transport system substrate-binding protein